MSLNDITETQHLFSLHPLFTNEDVLLFANRNKELELALDSIKIGKNLLVIGDRGIGKTSFINFLQHKIKNEVYNSKIYNIFVPINREVDLIKNLLISIIFVFEEEKIIDIMNVDNLKRNYEFIEALKKASIRELLLILENYIEKINQKYNKIIIIFDEIEKIAFDLTELSGIRDYLWKLNVVFIFSGHTKQHVKILNSAMEPFFTIIKLGIFNEKHIQEMLKKRIKHFLNKELNELVDLSAIPIIYKYSNGNPRNILQIMDFAFNYAKFNNDEKITEYHVYEYIKSKIDFKNNSLQETIFQILKEHPDGLSVSEITNEIKKRNFNYSRSRVSQILTELNKKNILFLKKIGRKSFYKIEYIGYVT